MKVAGRKPGLFSIFYSCLIFAGKMRKIGGRKVMPQDGAVHAVAFAVTCAEAHAAHTAAGAGCMERCMRWLLQ